MTSELLETLKKSEVHGLQPAQGEVRYAGAVNWARGLGIALGALSLLAEGCGKTTHHQLAPGDAGGTGGSPNLGGSAPNEAATTTSPESTSSGGTGAASSDDVFTACPNLSDRCASGTNLAVAQLVEASFLFVVDRSQSMLGEGVFVSRWQESVDAVSYLMELFAYDSEIGLVLYPSRADASPLECVESGPADAGDCCSTQASQTTTEFVGRGVDYSDRLIALLAGAEVGGGSPLAQALRSAREFYAGGGSAEAGEKAIVLVSDGGANCSTELGCESDGSCRDSCQEALDCDDSDAALAAVEQLRDDGVFVLVLGANPPEDRMGFLEDLSIAGGLAPARSGARPYRYYAATNPSSATDRVLGLGVRLVTNCEVPLPGGLPDDASVAVDCEIVPEFAPQGEAGAGGEGLTRELAEVNGNLVILGEECERIQQGVSRVDLLQGCH